MKDIFKLDFDGIKRTRMAMMLGFSPDNPESWPMDLIDRLISGELEHGLEWVFQEFEKTTKGPK